MYMYIIQIILILHLKVIIASLVIMRIAIFVIIFSMVNSDLADAEITIW